MSKIDLNLAALGSSKILINPLAVQLHRKFDVVQMPIAKRRKRWRVVKREWTTPSCYQLLDGSLVMHPEIWAPE